MGRRLAGMAAMIGLACWPMAARGQIPGLPAGVSPTSPGMAAPAVPGMSGLSGAGASAAGAGSSKSIWSCLGLSPASLAACQAKFCASPFGQMSNSMMGGPLAAVTGGFLPTICPAVPNASQLAALDQQPGGAAAAAARIKASEADAKARVAAVEYLGTVDCSRWPEARKSLIYSLREDTSECVRFAAARALNTGCCCSKEVIEALRICVSGEDTDHAPPENSPRVKASAFCALQNCLLKVPEDLPVEVPPEPGAVPPPDAVPLPPERAAGRAADGTHLAASYATGRARAAAATPTRTFARTVDDARRTMFAVAASPQPTVVLPTGQRSVFNAFAKARRDVNDARARRAHPTEPRTAPTATDAEPSAIAADPATDAGEGRPAASEEPAASPSARRGLFGALFSSSSSER